MRILIVGLGSMGRRRIRNFQQIGGCDLAGFDVNTNRRNAVDIRTFEDFIDALDHWQPDAMVISTPPDKHLNYALIAATNGVHFFTEASVISGETSRLIQAIGDQDIIAAPSCTMKFHPIVQAMERRIAKGYGGKPLAIECRIGQHLADWHPHEDYRRFYVSKRATGGAREMVPYELNWMVHLFGRIEAVTGWCCKLSDLDADIDDFYSALIRFESGVIGSLAVDVISRPAVRRVRLVAEERTVEWNLNPNEGMYVAEMRAFLDAIRGKAKFPHSLVDDEYLLDVLAEIERRCECVT